MKIFLKDPNATADFGVEISKLISESKSNVIEIHLAGELGACLLYTSPSPRDVGISRMPSSA